MSFQSRQISNKEEGGQIMTDIRYRKHFEVQESRITVDYLTDRGQYHSAHWQHDLEMIYLLNGNARLIMDGEAVTLVQGEFIVIDSGQIFELSCQESFMQINVRVDREFLELRAGHLEDRGQTSYMYCCRRDQLIHEKLEPYLEMCELFKQLVPLYVNEPEGYRLKTESIILEILYLLVSHFSIPLKTSDTTEVGSDRKRIQDILDYIEKHYNEHLTLAEIADEFGLNREYFSRMFHRKLGITFLQHVNRVRIAHFYHDLVTTDRPIMDLLDEHGLTNYKQFSRMFREIYGSSPRKVRQLIG